MEIVRNILLVLHFVGLASLLGGFMVQMSAFRTRSGRINPAILHGALTQVVTGLLLVGVAEMGDADVNHVKIGIKLVVALTIYVLALVFRKKETISNGILGTIGLLTLVNIVVAVFV
ncbi:hypothetical protein [Ruicaihuangia caeni]|uniref:hypothetical protein n=1 Tax=Ruicaihuangia caeni TaxID=3042517 RepID=UPI0033906938